MSQSQVWQAWLRALKWYQNPSLWVIHFPASCSCYDFHCLQFKIRRVPCPLFLQPSQWLQTFCLIYKTGYEAEFWSGLNKDIGYITTSLTGRYILYRDPVMGYVVLESHLCRENKWKKKKKKGCVAINPHISSLLRETFQFSAFETAKNNSRSKVISLI